MQLHFVPRITFAETLVAVKVAAKVAAIWAVAANEAELARG
jgi:hypothetical protein